MTIKIGKNCKIMEYAIIRENVKIGNNVDIGNGALIREGVTIDDWCKIGFSTTIERNAKLGRYVNIQSLCSIAEFAVIEEGVFIGPSVIFLADKNINDNPVPHIIKRGARIGGNSTIIGGKTIGRCSFLGAHSSLTKDIPDFKVAYGNPARIIREITREEILQYQKKMLGNKIQLPLPEEIK